MPILALIALLPDLASAIGETVALVQRLQAEGRAETTAEETALLNAALARLTAANANFDDAFKGVK